MRAWALFLPLRPCLELGGSCADKALLVTVRAGITASPNAQFFPLRGSQREISPPKVIEG